MEQLGITGTEAILIVGAVAGAVELIKRIFAKDWKAAVTIVAAGLIGGLLSLFPEISFTFLTGVIGGLSASGFITIGQNVGKEL